MADAIRFAIPYLIHVEFGHRILCSVLLVDMVEEEDILLHTLNARVLFDYVVVF